MRYSKAQMSRYYRYEERLGRVRNNKDLIEASPNVIDLEPYAISRASLREGNLRSHKVYSLYLKNGYVFIEEAKTQES